MSVCIIVGPSFGHKRICSMLEGNPMQYMGKRKETTEITEIHTNVDQFVHLPVKGCIVQRSITFSFISFVRFD